MDQKMNCWEFKGCGKEDKCPARSQTEFDGINKGENAGRACWAVVGTLCRNCVQTDLALKYQDCVDCDFFDYVHEGEDKDFSIFEEVYRRGLLKTETFGRLVKNRR